MWWTLKGIQSLTLYKKRNFRCTLNNQRLIRICVLNEDLTFICKLNYHDQKIQQTLACNIQNHWTTISILLDLISSVYRNLSHWRSNQRPLNTELKLYHWATCQHCTQAMPNQLAMAIVWPIKLMCLVSYICILTEDMITFTAKASQEDWRYIIITSWARI